MDVEILAGGRDVAQPFEPVDAPARGLLRPGHSGGGRLLLGGIGNGYPDLEGLGLQRLLKKQGDFIGRTLAQRAALTSTERLQLVGVRPSDRTRRLRNGSQLVAREAPDASLGYLTSATPSVEFEGWLALALLRGGRQRLGARLLARSPVHEEVTEVQILSPHMLDPENARVRG